MNPTYNYDDLYGTLISKNEDDTVRVYYIIECLCWKFYRWMFSYGWNKIRGKPCEMNGLRGFKVTLIKIIRA